jgi:meso-butanediol dehydrogenase/(S,S)-butanediol dehydrogenase/diacetyl reductase
MRAPARASVAVVMTDNRPHRALVTGGSRGIGRGVAVALAAAGFDVAAAARTVTGLDQTVAEAQARGGGAVHALAADVGDLDACAALPDRAAAALGGPVDVLVHCAGIARSAKIADLALEDWEQSMRVNATAAFVLAQRTAPAMVAAGWGRIVTIGSLYSRMGAKHAGAYAASKHALLGLTRVLAIEQATHGVTANTIVPGFTDTEMVREEAAAVAAARGIDAEESIRRFLRIQPLGRMVTVDEVGALVAFLCSDAAAPITAQAINVDGGALQS